MKQFNRSPIRTTLDILYTAFLPLLPAILIYGISKLLFNSASLWSAIFTYVVVAAVVFLFTFYKNSSRFEVDEREVRHYHFGKLVNTYAIHEYEFDYEMHVTSWGTASLKLRIQMNNSNKRTYINCLGIGEKQLKEMIEFIQSYQKTLVLEKNSSEENL